MKKRIALPLGLLYFPQREVMERCFDAKLEQLRWQEKNNYNDTAILKTKKEWQFLPPFYLHVLSLISIMKLKKLNPLHFSPISAEYPHFKEPFRKLFSNGVHVWKDFNREEFPCQRKNKNFFNRDRPQQTDNDAADPFISRYRIL